MRIQHLILSVDDSEEKMVFLVKMKNNIQDPNPKLIAYLTSIQKTFSKIFQIDGVRMQDEVIYSSNILLHEEGITGNFDVKKTFFHKEFGLFMNLVRGKHNLDDSVGEKKSVLFYLPRTSLFTGKDANQIGFQMADIQMPANQSLQKEPCFISFFEQQYHLYLAKDLIKSKEEPVFENKNTYILKDKVVVRIKNTLDFKYYL